MKKSIIILLIIILVMVAALAAISYISYPLKYTELVTKYSTKYNLDPSLVYSTINVESSFNSDSISKSNAMGLMQLLPTTANDIATRLNKFEYNILDPDTNIEFGCYYLRYLLDMYNGNLDYAIIAYNAGLGTLNNWLENNISMDDIPYQETKEYLKKIKFNIKIYNIKSNQ